MFNNKLNYKLINVTVLLLLLYIGFSNIGLWLNVITKIISVTSPFIIGFVIAYAFNPIVNFLERHGLKRGLALALVVIFLILIIAGIGAVILPVIYDQLSLCIKMITKVIENIDARFDINLGNFEIKTTDYLNEILKNVGTLASSTTIDIVSKSINIASKTIVAFVGFIYFLLDMNAIRERLKEMLHYFGKKYFNYFKLMDKEISNYLKGLGIFMVIQFIEYSLLFYIVGHPNWLLLGTLACITTVIPYFGGLITNILAIIMASVVSKPLFIATTIICLIFPQLDGYFISPKIYGKTNNVNPLITIMAVSIGGTLAGTPGIVVALPCYLLIRTTYNFFRKDLKKGLGKVKEAI